MKSFRVAHPRQRKLAATNAYVGRGGVERRQSTAIAMDEVIGVISKWHDKKVNKPIHHEVIEAPQSCSHDMDLLYIECLFFWSRT